MQFTLKQTQDYLKDIQQLPRDIREIQLPQAHRQLQEDPKQNSLRSHPFRGFQSERVFRSYIDMKYRIAWWYDDNRSIILWRVGKHKMIDELENLKRLPFVKIEREIPARLTENAVVEHQPPDLIHYGPLPLFSGYTPLQLQLFGVPDNYVDEVRRAIDIDTILAMDLPSHAKTILESIYTNPDWTPDCLLDIRQVLYRASADHLEHYCTGKIRALMLDLSDEQEQIVHIRVGGTMLIKGVAGSGKTTVGVYRALTLAKERRMFDRQPVLFLTYNETLAKVVGRMFEELTHRDEHRQLQERVKVSTLRDWACETLRKPGWGYNAQRAKTLLNSSISACVPKDSSYQFLKQEYFVEIEIAQVIKGRGIQDWETYRKVERIGRGQPLQEGPRRLIWEIYTEYQQRLAEEQIWDEADLYLESAAQITEDPTFEPYAEVVVDEAQDLPPRALELAARLAGGGKSERLTLLADPTQSIYYRGISWKDGGVNIHRSRIRSLDKNFRNSRQILEVAWALASADPQRTLNEAIQPASTDRPGPKPVLIEVIDQSQQDLKCMKELIVKLTGSNRYRFGDIAILCRKNKRVKEVTNYLDIARIPVCHFREESFDVFENDIKAITIHSAKGLEFPVVILLDVSEGDLPRNIAHIQTPDDLAATLRIERQLLYVGMTRASEELYLIYVQGRRSRFLNDIPEELLRNQGWGTNYSS